MNETKDANVPPKAQGSEIVIQKGNFFRDAQISHEIGLSPIQSQAEAQAWQIFP